MESPVLVALKDKLAEWDAGALDAAEQTQAGGTTAAPLYMHEEIHEYIVKFPGRTTSEYMKDLAAMGIVPGSSRSLISQMLQVGLLVRDDKRRMTAVGAYKIVRASALKKARKQKLAARNKVVRESVEEVGEKSDNVVQVTAVKDTNKAKSVPAYIETLNVHEAKALYLALKELFTV
jgi:hypothetical protein